jgi:PAS domain S-box-containing protein
VSDVSGLIHRSLLGDAWDNASAPISVFSDDGLYIACNAAFCALTGYTREEIMQMRVGVDLAPNEKDNRELFEDIVAGRTRFSPGRMRRKNGEIIDVEVWAIDTTVAGLPYHIVLYLDPRD